MSLPGYDAWLLRGSGVYSTEAETDLDAPCAECGSTNGLLHTDDFGSVSLWCECGAEQPYSPEEEEYGPEDEDQQYLDDRAADDWWDRSHGE